jgi:DNA-binding LacI/PurR family transcriptional regulator
MSTLDVRGPLPVTRRAQLLEALHRQGTVRISELTELLGVTAVTVRRDIAQLADEGLVQRVHGGAALLDHDHAVDESEEAGHDLTPTSSLQGRTVGMLVPSLDYYWPEVILGAEESASRHGLRVVLRGSSYEADDTRSQLARMIDKTGVSGLVLAPNMSAAHTRDALEWLSDSGLPVVLVERQALVQSHDAVVESVVSDHALGGAMAVRHLASLGHRRVGLVLSRLSPTGAHIRRGWLEAAAEVGFDPAGTVDTDVSDTRSPGAPAELDAAIERALTTGTTALIVHADAEAIALVQRLEAHGIAMPGQMSVVAYDDEVAGLFSPRLTAVRPPRRSLGRAAIDLVAARLADPGRPTHRVIISPSLRVRESTAPPPAP